jgi:2-desacetyl-2-hydroxyethyl bacteriochlorophyllide A dehydrogenase
LLGVWLENNKLSVRDDIEIPRPASDEALVRVVKAGICATDLELVNGYYPFTRILGHEFVGEVIECPSNASLVSQRVTAMINIACGECRQCRNDRPHHCEKREVLGIKEHHGAFAEFLTVPIANIIAVPNGISDEAAVFIEPLAAALRIHEQILVTQKDKVLVLGGGKLGQLIAQSFAQTGCLLQVAARYPNQILLLDSRGIISIHEDSIPPQQYDLVVEVTGTPDGFSLAQRAVRPEGIIVLKSTFKENTSVDLSAAVVNEITVIGSRCGLFEPAVRLLMKQGVDPTILIEHQYPLTDALAAFEKAAAPGAMKILLTP